MNDRCHVHNLEWKQGRNMANAPIGRYCPWDGSMHPDEFMAYIHKPGTKLGPTDKNYKCYVDVTEHGEPDEMRVISARNHGGPEDGWTQVGPEERKLMESDGWRGDYTFIKFALRGVARESKFYFEHLSVDQRKLFVELLNTRKLNLGYPGHFYVLPFFVSHG